MMGIELWLIGVVVVGGGASVYLCIFYLLKRQEEGKGADIYYSGSNQQEGEMVEGNGMVISSPGKDGGITLKLQRGNVADYASDNRSGMTQELSSSESTENHTNEPANASLTHHNRPSSNSSFSIPLSLVKPLSYIAPLLKAFAERNGTSIGFPSLSATSTQEPDSSNTEEQMRLAQIDRANKYEALLQEQEQRKKRDAEEEAEAQNLWKEVRANAKAVEELCARPIPSKVAAHADKAKKIATSIAADPEAESKSVREDMPIIVSPQRVYAEEEEKEKEMKETYNTTALLAETVARQADMVAQDLQAMGKELGAIVSEVQMFGHKFEEEAAYSMERIAGLAISARQPVSTQLPASENNSRPTQVERVILQRSSSPGFSIDQ